MERCLSGMEEGVCPIVKNPRRYYDTLAEETPESKGATLLN